MAHVISARPDDNLQALEKPLATIGDVYSAAQGRVRRGHPGSFGYDRSRQDRAVHPFCIDFGGPGDVRITTRFDPGLVSVGLVAACHEAALK
jgi:carboxypeptidase Taq